MPTINDADGHVNDYFFGDEIAKYMPKGNQFSQMFPLFDHLHFRYLMKNRVPRYVGGSMKTTPGPREWLEFIDETGIAWSVLYPSAGLGVGRIVSVEWAIAACRAYNNWLHDRFTSTTPRLKGVGLIPIQDEEAALAELQRCVTELGMVGAMLPSNGEAIKGHLGAKAYWPIYEEAEKPGLLPDGARGRPPSSRSRRLQRLLSGARPRPSFRNHGAGGGDAEPWYLRALSPAAGGVSGRGRDVGAVLHGSARSVLQ